MSTADTICIQLSYRHTGIIQDALIAAAEAAYSSGVLSQVRCDALGAYTAAVRQATGNPPSRIPTCAGCRWETSGKIPREWPCTECQRIERRDMWAEVV